MDSFTIDSASGKSGKVSEPIVLDETSITRRVFIAELHAESLDPGETVSGTIIHQKKSPQGMWENLDSINLNNLTVGENVGLRFNEKQVKNLYEGLNKLYKVSNAGFEIGESKKIVADPHEVIFITDQNKKAAIEQLLAKNLAVEIWEELALANPELATKLAWGRVLSNRKEVLAEFENSLLADRNEGYWQTFFASNTWIFGYGISYHFLGLFDDQPTYGNTNVHGDDTQRGDFLMNTIGDAKFSVLVEIKKPNTVLLTSKKNGEKVKYRNGAWLLSPEFIGAISQLQANCDTWAISASHLPNARLLSEQSHHVIRPRGILVIGNLNELQGDPTQIETFERFRKSIGNIDILTFDEVLERARHIIQVAESTAS